MLAGTTQHYTSCTTLHTISCSAAKAYIFRLWFSQIATIDKYTDPEPLINIGRMESKTVSANHRYTTGSSARPAKIETVSFVNNILETD